MQLPVSSDMLSHTLNCNIGNRAAAVAAAAVAVVVVHTTARRMQHIRSSITIVIATINIHSQQQQQHGQYRTQSQSQEARARSITTVLTCWLLIVVALQHTLHKCCSATHHAKEQTLHTQAGQVCCVYPIYFTSYLFSVALRKQQHLWGGEQSRGMLHLDGTDC
jgi:lysylphosphatidylglycerol synthetase-like protein (DUF2156 family)